MSFYIFPEGKYEEALVFARDKNTRKNASWNYVWVVDAAHSHSRNVDEWMVLRVEGFNCDKTKIYKIPKELLKDLKIEARAGNVESRQILVRCQYRGIKR